MRWDECQLSLKCTSSRLSPKVGTQWLCASPRNYLWDRNWYTVACISRWTSVQIGSLPTFFEITFENYIQLDYSQYTMDLNIPSVDSYSTVVNLSEYTLRMAFHKVFDAIIRLWREKSPPISSAIHKTSPTHNQAGYWEYSWTFPTCWIQPWLPFVHSFFGCRGTSKNVPNPAKRKFHPNSVYPLGNPNQEWDRLLRMFLDLYNMLNLAVDFVYP